MFENVSGPELSATLYLPSFIDNVHMRDHFSRAKPLMCEDKNFKLFCYRFFMTAATLMQAVIVGGNFTI
jgi:hypothetical protein